MSGILDTGKKTIIGMIHLPPLVTYPGSPGTKGLIKSALYDLHALEAGGVDAAIVENHNDDPSVIFLNKKNFESFQTVTREVVERASVPIGVSALRNDWKSAFSIAKAAGAKFIRLDALVDKVLMADKVVEVDGKELGAFRRKISAEKILLLADVQVKHAKMLEEKTLEKSVWQAIAAGANVVIVTGPLTGIAPTTERVRRVKLAARHMPVLVGSGVNAKNAKHLLAWADGAIVGTALKVRGRVDVSRVREITDIAAHIK